jgi:glycine/D-amino acid oxidase-like deaminating enzyme
LVNTDILIIGGGITGCALAYFLVKGGAKVVLVERHDLNTQASGSNAGSIHAQMHHELFAESRESEADRFRSMTLLLMAGIEFWKNIEKELDADFELDIIGGLLVADDDEQMRRIEKKVAFERKLGLPVDLLAQADIGRIAPYVSGAMIGGAFCPIEGEANALLVAPAFAAVAVRHGAQIMIETELLALTKDGNSFCADTSKGRITARRVVNCAGVAAGNVGKLLGVELPIYGEPIQVNVTEPAAPLVRHLVYFAGDRLTLKQSRRGALIIGGGWPARLDGSGRPTLRLDSVRGNLRVCRHVVPATASARVIRTWPALVNETGDGLPIIGETGAAPGHYVASFPSMGFTGGPIMASIVANMLLGQGQNLDVRPFSPDRFR